MHAHPPFTFFGPIAVSMLNFIPNFLSLEIYIFHSQFPSYLS